MKRIVTRLLVLGIFVLLTLVGCGGGGDDATPAPGTGLTITGMAEDVEAHVPVAGAAVTLRKAADNSSLATTSTTADGSYTLTNVPSSTDVYINVSKATYASFNTEVINLAANLSGKHLTIVSAANTKTLADQINGSAGGASWSDPFYTGKSWFAMSIEPDTTTHQWVPGVSVAVAPGGPVIRYKNGSGGFSATGPTVGGQSNGPLVAGSDASTGIYTFTMTKGSTTHSVKLPLVKGEITYTDIVPW